MNRRTAVRNIIIISAGGSLLPGCISSNEERPAHLKHLPLTASLQKMLSELTETIIPKTNNFTGAKDLKTDEFVLVMVDDCALPEDQIFFIGGMKAFEATCKKKFNTGFVKCTPQQRMELLKELETKDEKDLAGRFYHAVKRLTIQNFTSSKEYLLNVVKWKLVPGSNFKGCVPV
ncbi:MAG TPA: gluconate 2-dehydrogenase subunit 3 family protein [Chitinophagaceae bacterium]|nr:gluconate 2-dehydrogenase subunit 3 family protein [Chitinophagaceae bacterium]